MHLYLLVLLACTEAVLSHVYYTTCSESASRACSSSNMTDYLLTMKKGGTNVLSTSTYLYDFFLCEEYNYDCGYIPEANSFVNIANGVDLNMTLAEFTSMVPNSTIVNKVKPYLNLQGETAKCGMSLFPLSLTSTQSKAVIDGKMDELSSRIKSLYDAERDASSTMDWEDININIRTAILAKFKEDESLIGDSLIWFNLVTNNFTAISSKLKDYYKQSDNVLELHAAYLIDSVTTRCNKYQSVNFLIDESGSIGNASFALALNFLEMYLNSTLDDLSIMSIHFYDSSFEEYINYGNNYSYILNKIQTKYYRHLGTLTGIAINQTVSRILAANFAKGVPKILVILTDGESYDDVLRASNYARSFGISIIAVGIGPNVNDTQLLEIAQTSSNVIKVGAYSELKKLVEFISNYFCKQIITINLDETIEGNIVRVPESPSYFRIPKSQDDEYYQLDILFENDPVIHNQIINESQIDPFPDEYTEYLASESYEVFYNGTVANLHSEQPLEVGAFIPKKVYFIEPENQVDVLLKKNIVKATNASISYVAVRGTNLAFNISLKACSTINCSVERASYNKPNPTVPKASVIYVPPKQNVNSIFTIIGSTLAAMLCLCSLSILGIRKLRDDQQEKKLSQNSENHENRTEELIVENLMPENSNEPMNGAEGLR